MDLPEAQSSRHAKESKSGIPETFLLVESGILEILMEEFGILGFGISNPRGGIQNRRSDCFVFPYMRRQGDALTPDARRNWNSLMTLFIWAALLAMKMALGGDINKVMP